MIKNDIRINDIRALSQKAHHTFGRGDEKMHYTEEGYQELSKPIIEVLKEEISKLE